MKGFWNERYSREEFIYGKQPNEFFKEQLDKLKTGSILLPAEAKAVMRYMPLPKDGT